MAQVNNTAILTFWRVGKRGCPPE